jgi:hypothetical protein
VASSSRSQVVGPSPWGNSPGGLLVLSTYVRWRVSVFTAVVTQFVTHPCIGWVTTLAAGRT